MDASGLHAIHTFFSCTIISQWHLYSQSIGSSLFNFTVFLVFLRRINNCNLFTKHFHCFQLAVFHLIRNKHASLFSDSVCPDLPEIANATLNCTNQFRLRSECKYVCDQGLALYPLDLRGKRCLDNKTWADDPTQLAPDGNVTRRCLNPKGMWFVIIFKHWSSKMWNYHACYILAITRHFHCKNAQDFPSKTLE